MLVALPLPYRCLFVWSIATMTTKPWGDKDFENLLGMFDSMQGALKRCDMGGVEEAQKRITALLKRHNFTWDDLTALVEQARARRPQQPPPPGGTGSGGSGAMATPMADPQGIPGAELFSVLRATSESYIFYTEPLYHVATSLWAFHAHVFKRFKHTPRLHVRSAITGEGKTTVFDVLAAVCPNVYRDDSATGPSVRNRIADDPTPTVLLDELDEQGTIHDPLFRRILNSGYRHTGRVSHGLPKGRTRSYRTFAPMGLASVERLWPAIERRSIVIQMQKASAQQKARLQEFDLEDPQQKELLNAIYVEMKHWALNNFDKLNRFPPMPILPTDPLDAWRPLVAIADLIDQGLGEMAREAASRISGAYGENPKVSLLVNVRDVFDTAVKDLLLPTGKPDDVEVHTKINSKAQLTTKTVLANVLANHPTWELWEGPKNEHPPRALTEGELSRYLGDLGAKSSVLWPSPRDKKKDKSARGLKRELVDKACAIYADDDNGEPNKPTSGGMTRTTHWTQDVWRKGTTAPLKTAPEGADIEVDTSKTKTARGTAPRRTRPTHRDKPPRKTAKKTPSKISKKTTKKPAKRAVKKVMKPKRKTTTRKGT
jgi:hypothetical protein